MSLARSHHAFGFARPGSVAFGNVRAGSAALGRLSVAGKGVAWMTPRHTRNAGLITTLCTRRAHTQDGLSLSALVTSPPPLRDATDSGYRKLVN
ncbi:unnamed protein product [Plutella xylostella]|uniref:(diamondback moth) hypothetical protein n=1 Tax=Plutella xylostella TaxID=51655 RepID=A0A8S4EUG9_PLUXY|nr:unnamed protein product [Plutella xylostella]